MFSWRFGRIERLNQIPKDAPALGDPPGNQAPTRTRNYTGSQEHFETVGQGSSISSPYPYYLYANHPSSTTNTRPLSRSYARSSLYMGYPPHMASVPISHHARSQTPTFQRLAQPQPIRYPTLLLRTPSTSSTPLGSPESPGEMVPEVGRASPSGSNTEPTGYSSSVPSALSVADDNPFAFIPWDPRFPLRPPNGGFTIGPNENYDEALLKLENWIREHTGLHPERGDLDNYYYTGDDPAFWLPDGDNFLPLDGPKS